MSARRLPTYRHHRPSGRAVVTLDGKDHYLGKHGSRESKAEYRRLIADWQDDLRRRPALSAEALTYPLTVSEIAITYWLDVETYYVKDGQPTSEQSNIQSGAAVRPVTLRTDPGERLWPPRTQRRFERP